MGERGFYLCKLLSEDLFAGDEQITDPPAVRLAEGAKKEAEALVLLPGQRPRVAQVKRSLSDDSACLLQRCALKRWSVFHSNSTETCVIVRTFGRPTDQLRAGTAA